jgi:hypothetical protein
MRHENEKEREFSMLKAKKGKKKNKHVKVKPLKKEKNHSRGGPGLSLFGPPPLSLALFAWVGLLLLLPPRPSAPEYANTGLARPPYTRWSRLFIASTYPCCLPQV